MQQINLYRPIFRKQEKKFSTTAMLQGGAAIMVGVAVIYGLMWWQVKGLREEVHQATRQLEAATKRAEEATKKFSPSTLGKSLEEEVSNLEKQVAARQKVRDMMSRGLFSNTRGYSDFFVAFARQHVSGVWITSFDITGAGEDMRLQGRTVNPAQVPRYVQRLSSEQVLAGKEFEVFTMTRPAKKDGQVDEAPYVEFMFRTSVAKAQGRS